MHDIFNYKRRKSDMIDIGNLSLGGSAPLRVQTMLNCDTCNTEDCVQQALKVAESGAELIRLTAQGVRHAQNLHNIKRRLEEERCFVPLVADIHFNPEAALVAAQHVEKVRINPGNYHDGAKRFSQTKMTDEHYQAEICATREKLLPLIDLCRKRSCALRIGVNYGSLSDRIVARYGNTPEGMAASCMEFLKLITSEGFYNIVISLKASNVVVMTAAVRLLIEQMEAEDFHFPLHLGVTEAGEGEDGRIKSAVGIGSLLADGIGDTIRVSLSEDPAVEPPVASKLCHYISLREGHSLISQQPSTYLLSHSPWRRHTYRIANIGAENRPVVVSSALNGTCNFAADLLPDYIYSGSNPLQHTLNISPQIVDYASWNNTVNTYPLFRADDFTDLDTCNASLKFMLVEYGRLTTDFLASLSQLSRQGNIVIILDTHHINIVGELRAAQHLLADASIFAPVILRCNYEENDLEDLQLKAGSDLGALLLDGIGSGIWIYNEGKIPQNEIDTTSFGILQAARLHQFKTEYISCPGCGRTLFDLSGAVSRIKAATSHLRHLKIGVMGCIVNGPGEMADSDYGYVGAARGKISLYKRQQCIEKNIPEEEAVERLIDIIKANGDWIDPDNKDINEQ